MIFIFKNLISNYHCSLYYYDFCTNNLTEPHNVATLVICSNKSINFTLTNILDKKAHIPPVYTPKKVQLASQNNVTTPIPQTPQRMTKDQPQHMTPTQSKYQSNCIGLMIPTKTRPYVTRPHNNYSAMQQMVAQSNVAQTGH